MNPYETIARGHVVPPNGVPRLGISFPPAWAKEMARCAYSPRTRFKPTLTIVPSSGRPDPEDPKPAA